MSGGVTQENNERLVAPNSGNESPALSEVTNEDNINALNDVFQQNEMNLDSFLDQIQEIKEQEEEGASEGGQSDAELTDKIKEKRLELKYVSGEQRENFASDRSLRDHNLSINQNRLNKKNGTFFSCIISNDQEFSFFTYQFKKAVEISIR